MKNSYRRKIGKQSLIRIRSTHEPGRIIGLPSRETSWKYMVELLAYPNKKLTLLRNEIRKLRLDEIRNLRAMIQSAYEIRQLCDHGNRPNDCLVCELRKEY